MQKENCFTPSKKETYYLTLSGGGGGGAGGKTHLFLVLK